MAYTIRKTKQADKDIDALKKSGNKSLIKKLANLLVEIADNPRSGTGQVEQLKHYPYKQTWSRRLNQEYRIVYEIHDDTVVVLVLSLMDHYGDK
ncbi:MAG: Txe/YoeB family addiction module toxin [Bacteroidales bacterium]|jgi:toxin YoeB|nr:Txe/YoeB family addiction module toxin [Bacteroidales bacterium]MBR4324861.1 Txe/YoeB family addiction module toxin [Bacteroidales bacterium]